MLCSITYMKWVRVGEIPSVCMGLRTTVGPILIKYYRQLKIVGPFFIFMKVDAMVSKFRKLVNGIAKIIQNAMLQGACRPTVCRCGADSAFPVFLCSKRLTRSHWFPACLQKFEPLSHGACLP